MVEVKNKTNTLETNTNIKNTVNKSTVNKINSNKDSDKNKINDLNATKTDSWHTVDTAEYVAL